MSCEISNKNYISPLYSGSFDFKNVSSIGSGIFYITLRWSLESTDDIPVPKNGTGRGLIWD